MMVKKFPLRIAPVPRKESSVAQQVAFARRDIECSILFLDHPGHEAIIAALRVALDGIAALGLPSVHYLGCCVCNDDVPLDVPDLAQDRMCRRCADDSDRAAAIRRSEMKAARQQHARAAR